MKTWTLMYAVATTVLTACSGGEDSLGSPQNAAIPVTQYSAEVQSALAKAQMTDRGDIALGASPIDGATAKPDTSATGNADQTGNNSETVKAAMTDRRMT